MSQLSKVAKVLRQNTEVPGVTPAKIARLSGIPKRAVYRRVHELRTLEGKEIYSNFRTIRGKKVMFYRIAS